VLEIILLTPEWFPWKNLSRLEGREESWEELKLHRRACLRSIFQVCQNQQKESQSDFKFLSDAHKQCKRLRTRVEREEELQGVVQLALQQQQQEKKTLNPLRRKQKRTEMTGATNRLPLCGLHSTVFLPPSGHRLFSFLHN
jgi:hypothetical protein